MTNETLTQKVLFDVNEEPEKLVEPKNPNKNSKRKRLPKYVIIPLVTAGVLAAGFGGAIKYHNNKVINEINQKQIQYRESREDMVLRIAKGEFETSVVLDLISAMFTGVDDSLTDKEIEFIKKYRKDHPEYSHLKEPSRIYTSMPKRNYIIKRYGPSETEKVSFK